MNLKFKFLVLFAVLNVSLIFGQELSADEKYKLANELPWKISFNDDCTESWKDKWVMDGKRSYITHSNLGMDYFAGKIAYNDTCHTVLWTKQKFSGDIKVEYDYTRLDSSAIGVNIIYLLATGSGKDIYNKEIFKWNDQRQIPAMKEYYNHMNTYHISYAVNGPGNEEPDYVRARRYMPESGKGLKGTALSPEYSNTGLFAPGVKHHITVIRRGSNLYMHVSNQTQTKLFWFDTSQFPQIVSGRVGLRQMWTRAARYANIKIYEL